MKKTQKVSVVCVLVCCFLACFSLSACVGKLSKDKETEIANAYLEYLQAKDTDYYETTFEKYAGTYSDDIVAVLKWKAHDKTVVAVNIDLYVDDIFICKLPQGDYCVMVYTKDKKIKTLEEAYNDGDITKDNLKSIARNLKNF